MAKKPLIHCDRHGKSKFSVACIHLCTGVGQGYYAVGPSEPDHPAVHQAWCQACHRVLEREGGWNKTALSHADMKCVCARCYGEVVQRHTRLPLAA